MDLIIALGDFLWGGTWNGQRMLAAPPMVVALLGVGLWLMIRLRGRPLRRLGWALAQARRGGAEASRQGMISPLKALATALGGQIGVGKIVGVATAITLGGPGAVFWMWVTALLGTALAFAESALAIHYRERGTDGAWRGGPMVYIRLALGPRWRWLAVLFSVGTLVASLGATALIQSNSLVAAVTQASGGLGWSVSPVWPSAILAVLVFAAIVGGLRSIGAVASWLTPFMASAYVIASLVVLGLNVEHLPAAIRQIFASAFGLEPALGGVLGYGLLAAMRAGVARGLASNEAGQGTTPIVHATSSTRDPALQGGLAAFGVLIDTLVICSMTALVILSVPGLYESGDGAVERAWMSSTLEGGAITAAAFDHGFPGGRWVVFGAILLFAYTTLTTWNYYAEQALVDLAGPSFRLPFRVLWASVVFIGGLQPIEVVWRTGDFAIAMMTIPNLIALLVLSGVVVKLTARTDPMLAGSDQGIEQRPA